MIGTKLYKNNPVDMTNYTNIAIWCNTNNAVIVDKDEYYEVVTIVIPLAEIKQAKIAELKSARDTEELSPISYGGYLWDFDEKAQMRINGAITALGDNTITWTSADNEEIKSVTVDDLKGVVGASAIRSNELHIKYRTLKAQVEACKTIDEVNTIEW